MKNTVTTVTCDVCGRVIEKADQGNGFKLHCQFSIPGKGPGGGTIFTWHVISIAVEQEPCLRHCDDICPECIRRTLREKFNRIIPDSPNETPRCPMCHHKPDPENTYKVLGSGGDYEDYPCPLCKERIYA